MANVLLLLDPDSPDATTVPSVLERQRHTPKVTTGLQDALLHLMNDAPRYDVVVVDLSRNRPSDWQALDELMRVSALVSPKPMVLGFSAVYHGPSMKLEVERRGGRFVWI